MTNTKKYVEELDVIELEEVYKNNGLLANEVIDYMYESENSYVREQMQYIKDSLTGWAISDTSPSYITVDEGKMREFLEDVEHIQKDYGLLNIDEEEHLTNAQNKLAELENVETYTKDYNTLESELSRLIEEVADTVAKNLESYIQGVHNIKNQIEYFMVFYSEVVLNKECYIIIDENGTSDYVLHEDVISYTKSYE